jgi:DNA polymerase-1
LLVDGHNLLFKAFYGVPERLLPDGRPIQGVLGFIGMLRKIIKLTAPTHVLVVFDPEEQPTRSLISMQYKKNRIQDFTGLPDRVNPFSQLAGIYQALEILGIRFIEESGYEADDMIAGYATRAKGKVIIVSTDSDFFQIVDENIAVLRYYGKKSVTYDENTIEKRYGIRPAKFLEFKALTGDKSDNIKGIRGVGPKTALKILAGVKGLNPEEEKLFAENMDILRLCTSAPLPVSIDRLSLDKRILDVKMGDLLAGLQLL